MKPSDFKVLLTNDWLTNWRTYTHIPGNIHAHTFTTPLPPLAKFTCFLKLAKELILFKISIGYYYSSGSIFKKKTYNTKRQYLLTFWKKNAAVLPLVSLVALNGELNIFKVSRDHPLKKITEIYILNYSAVPAGSLLVPLMLKPSFAQVIQKGPFSFPKVAKFIS